MQAASTSASQICKPQAHRQGKSASLMHMDTLFFFSLYCVNFYKTLNSTLNYESKCIPSKFGLIYLVHLAACVIEELYDPSAQYRSTCSPTNILSATSIKEECLQSACEAIKQGNEQYTVLHFRQVNTPQTQNQFESNNIVVYIGLEVIMMFFVYSFQG